MAERDPAKLCTFVLEDGTRCRAYKTHDSEFCYPHKIGREAMRDIARRGGQARADKHQEAERLRDQWNHPWWPVETLRRAVAVVEELLEMTLPGTGEPNYEARAFGVELGTRLFQLHPERDEEILGSARAALLDAYRKGRLDVRGIPAEVFGLPDVEPAPLTRPKSLMDEAPEEILEL